MSWHRVSGMGEASVPVGEGAEKTAAAAVWRLVRNLALYTVARLLLLAALAAAITVVARLLSIDIPLFLALALAIVLALPASLVVFRRLRARTFASLAVVGAQRRADRARMRARLRGQREP